MLDPVHVFGPAEYFNAAFGGTLTGDSVSATNYVAWCADINGDFSPTATYTLYNTYSLLPPAPWSADAAQFGAVNWLLNNKPTSVTYQTGCDATGNNCTGTASTTDARTIRDVIQQTIWKLFEGTTFCCSLLDGTSAPTRPQYNGTLDNGLGGGYNIASFITTLYNQALTHTGFVPATGQVVAVFGYTASDQSILIELPVSPILPTGPFTTVTQGGWGAPPHGNNPGAILLANFASVYPSGVTIGGTFTLKFTSASAIQSFLPAKGGPGQLTASFTNTTNSFIAGEFAGQVLALQLNVDFSAKGIFHTGLGALVLTSGPLAGKTVNQVLALANAVLGGAAPPAGLTLSQLNDVVTGINEMFDK